MIKSVHPVGYSHVYGYVYYTYHLTENEQLAFCSQGLFLYSMIIINIVIISQTSPNERAVSFFFFFLKVLQEPALYIMCIYPRLRKISIMLTRSALQDHSYNAWDKQ